MTRRPLAFWQLRSSRSLGSGHSPKDQRPQRGRQSMRKRITGLAVAAALVLGASSAGAADQLIIGKKLLIKNTGDLSKNKVVFLSKDATLEQPTGALED